MKVQIEVQHLQSAPVAAAPASPAPPVPPSRFEIRNAAKALEGHAALAAEHLAKAKEAEADAGEIYDEAIRAEKLAEASTHAAMAAAHRDAADKASVVAAHGQS